MGRQTGCVQWFSIAALACAALACGDAEKLSVGELRCEGVSCAPIEITAPHDGEHIEIEHVDRDEELVPVIGQQLFCGELPALSEIVDQQESGSDPTCLGEKLIPVGEENFIVATKYVAMLGAERIESGLRLARYAGEELQWESTELSRELAYGPGYFGDAFEIASSAVPGEAIVGMTLETGAHSAYGQTFYVLKDDGELNQWFEDTTAGRVLAIAAVGEDIVVASDYEQRIELTRYDAQGEIAWRQTTLTLGEEYTRESGGVAFEETAVRVIDGERIIVLVPRRSSFQLMELTSQGELVRSWIHKGRFDDAVLGMRLALGARGQFFVGMDGYEIDRGSLVRGKPRLDSFSKHRSQYWDPAVLGLHVDRAGYIYIATIDGDLGRPYGLIERVSPDLSRRESFLIAGDDLAPEGLSLVIGGELYVTEDQRKLHFAAGGTVGKIELPPIED